MFDFIAWAVGIAVSMATLLFLIKLYLDRRASPRGAEGSLAAPGRSGWVGLIGFFASIFLFPVGAAQSLNLPVLDLIWFWEPGLLDGDELRWFAVCLFGSAVLTVLLFLVAHLPWHRKHLPWFGRSTQ